MARRTLRQAYLAVLVEAAEPWFGKTARMASDTPAKISRRELESAFGLTWRHFWRDSEKLAMLAQQVMAIEHHSERPKRA